MDQTTDNPSAKINPRWVWAARATALIAAGVACFLSWKSIHGSSIPGCDGVSLFDCEHVLKSRWSRWLGIPVGILGAGTYLGVLAASFGLGDGASSSMRRLAGLALTGMLTLAVLCGIWFTALQFFDIGKICPFCLVSHICGLLTAILLLVAYAVTPVKTTGWMAPASMAFCGVVGFAILVFGQWMWPYETFEIERYDDVELAATDNAYPIGSPADDFDAPVEFVAPDDSAFAAPGDDESAAPTEDAIVNVPIGSSDEGLPEEILQMTFTRRIPVERFVRFSPKLDPIDTRRYPILGDPAAEYVVIEMADYTCEHCREMYHHLEHVRGVYGDRISIVVCPIALEKKCNPFVRGDNPKHVNACDYAKLALAVWREAPDRFADFHHWLMDSLEAPPSVSDARARATELIGEQALQKHLGDTQLLLMLTSNHDSWNSIGGPLPMVFFGGRLIRGVPRSGEKLVEAFETIMPSLAPQ